MDDTTPSRPNRSPSELGAAEALDKLKGSQAGDDQKPGQADRVTCPNCGREVEAGFRFCDGCGRPLAATRAGDPAPKKEQRTEEVKPPAIELPREQREELEVPRQGPVPLLERWRKRRRERSQLGKAERALSQAPPIEAPAPEVPTASSPRPVGATSRPKTAEELRGASPAIGGRLQWAAPEEGPERAADLPVWRPVAVPAQPEERPRAGEVGRFLVQFGIAFLAGAITLVGLAAIIAVASDGRLAFLEVRGLPIFVGGSVSILLFALLRTNERSRAEPAKTRRGTIATLVGALVALVALAALLYQPAITSRVQPRIERLVRVFGAQDADAVEGFEASIREWNQRASEYHSSLQTALREPGDVDRLRAEAVEAETNLDGITSQMRTQAESAQHPQLRDTLSDLASIYEDRLGGLRLVNRGLLVDNIELVRNGDAAFKDAYERATTVFSSRLRPLLMRGGFDARSFERAIAG